MKEFFPSRFVFQQSGDVPEACSVGAQSAEQQCVDLHDDYLRSLDSKLDLANGVLADHPDNQQAREFKESAETEKDHYVRMMFALQLVFERCDQIIAQNLNTKEGGDLLARVLSTADLTFGTFEKTSKKYPAQQAKFQEVKGMFLGQLKTFERRITDILVRNDLREYLGQPRLPETLEQLRERVKGEDLSQFFTSIDGLGPLGEGVAYYALKIPEEWDTPEEMAKNMGLVCNWNDVLKYNRDKNRAVQAGKAVHIPAKAFLDETIKSDRQVQFVEVTIDETRPDKLKRVLGAMCVADKNLGEKVQLFTASYFYKKNHPRNRYAIPVSMLKMDWKASLVAEHPERPLNLGREPYKNPDLFGRAAIEGLDPYHPESLDSMVERGLVSQVTDDTNFVWALNGDGTPQCQEGNQYLTGYAKDALNEIGDVFHNTTGAFIRITAMYRSKQYQRDIQAYEPNAADQSTHFFANSFDIPKNTYCGPGRNDLGWPPAGDRVAGHARSLRDILEDMQEAGKIMFIRESNCYHVTVINPRIGGGDNIERPHRPISPEPEYAPIHPENVPESFDPTQIEGFAKFNRDLLDEMKKRKKAGDTMSIGEIQTKIVEEFLPKLRAAGKEETARLLEGRSWEVAHVMAILSSRQESQDSKAASHLYHLYVYDEDQTVFQDNASFVSWKNNYELFKSGQIEKGKVMTLVDLNGRNIGTYNMYEYLMESNLDEVTSISRSLLMAALAARETSFINLRNGTEKNEYTGENVFGYFQITAVQRGKIEDRAKEIFEELDDTIPGSKWDFKEFTVNFKGHNCHINPKMEIAIAVAMMEHNQAVFKQTNHSQDHPDQELLALVGYNGGGAPIEYLLQFGVSVAREPKASTGKYKLSYVDKNGTVNIAWITEPQKVKVWKYLREAMVADNGSIDEVVPIYNLRRYFRDTLFTGPGTQSQFIAGREVGLRISEVEKAFTCKPGVVGQVYISEVISHAIGMKYMDSDNYDGMHKNALRDAMILLSSPGDVISSENLAQLDTAPATP